MIIMRHSSCRNGGVRSAGPGILTLPFSVFWLAGSENPVGHWGKSNQVASLFGTCLLTHKGPRHGALHWIFVIGSSSLPHPSQEGRLALRAALGMSKHPRYDSINLLRAAGDSDSPSLPGSTIAYKVSHALASQRPPLMLKKFRKPTTYWFSCATGLSALASRSHTRARTTSWPISSSHWGLLLAKVWNNAFRKESHVFPRSLVQHLWNPGKRAIQPRFELNRGIISNINETLHYSKRRLAQVWCK